MIKNRLNPIFGKLQRVTSSSLFIPEIDGLRFLAIAIVILFHINVFVIAKSSAGFADDPSSHALFYNFIANGFKGVHLFFVISGFILAMPFANYYFGNGKKVNLKGYLLRRITRLEPPYIITMVICFFLMLLTGRDELGNLLPSLGTSLAYIHNIFPYGQSVNGVAWSLEIEIQFYLLAPILARIFILKAYARRLILFAAILSLPILQSSFNTPFITLYNYLQYFLIGFILVDLYINKFRLDIPKKIGVLAGLALFLIIIYIPITGNAYNEIIFLFSILFFYFLVLNDVFWKKIFTLRLFTAIGGMCYTLYLWHDIVMAAIGNSSIFWNVSDQYILTFLFQTLVILPFILAFSVAFFLLIEKPCMDKNWPRKLCSFLKERTFWNKLFKNKISELEPS